MPSSTSIRHRARPRSSHIERHLHGWARMRKNVPRKDAAVFALSLWASPSQHYGRMHQRPEPEMSAFDTKNRALTLGYDILGLVAGQWCPASSVLRMSDLTIGRVA